MSVFEFILRCGFVQRCECEYEFEFPPNYSNSLIQNSGLYTKNLKLYLSSDKIKHNVNLDINKHYKGLMKTTRKSKKLIRGIIPCWDNFPRHTSIKSNFNIQVDSNSLLFYFMLVKQFLLTEQDSNTYSDKQKLFFINSLNEWGEQCVLEPSIQCEYSYLEALKLAKKTDLSMVDEELLDNIING